MKLFAIILIIIFEIQNLFAQTTTPPDMPIPPEFSQPASPVQSTESSPPAQVPAPNPAESALMKSRLPDDFELIAIRPYFKNKARLGHLIVTLSSSQNENLASIEGDFGDCKNCIRGASVKGKIGIRLYGNTLKDLTISRKQSSSIKLENCHGNKESFTNIYTCEFSHKEVKMKLTLKLDP